MARKCKGSASGGEEPAEPLKNKQFQSTTDRWAAQARTLPPTIPGTALTAFLMRYRYDLLSLPYDRHVSQLMDFFVLLLMEAEGRC